MTHATLTDQTFRKLRDYIYEQSGIFIADTKKYLIESRLARILKESNLKSFEDYLTLIQCSANGNVRSRLFDAITTNETYFFREPHQLNVFSELIRDICKKKNGAGPVRIWSAACSSGEEPYTLSMMLRENLMPSKQIDIYASDLSKSVLESARKAVFNSYSVRNIPEHYLNKYFSVNGQSYILNDTIKNSVTFMNINLLESIQMKSLRGMDIIFCRNALIYFDTKAKQKVVSNLYDNLNPGGYLCIGASESLHNVTMAFCPSVINKVIMYQKVQK